MKLKGIHMKVGQNMKNFMKQKAKDYKLHGMTEYFKYLLIKDGYDAGKKY